MFLQKYFCDNIFDENIFVKILFDHFGNFFSEIFLAFWRKYFCENILGKNIFVTIFLVKIFWWKYFLIIFGKNIFVTIFLLKYFLIILGIFFRNIFGVWAKIFLWKYFWLKYFWWKYFGENIFWSFFDHQGFPFGHEGSTPQYTSFWSEVWRTDGRTDARTHWLFLLLY